MASDLAPDNLPTVICPKCGRAMRLIGIETHNQNPDAYLVTFECALAHLATTTFLKPLT